MWRRCAGPFKPLEDASPESRRGDRRVYGRRQDRPLKARQRKLWAELLPQVAVPDPERAPIDLPSLFPNARAIALEIGFGGGEHLAWQAEHEPNVGFLGAEPFINGVAKLLTAIDDRELNNIRIFHGDARTLIEALPDASIEKVYVLHPDPWPKRRHWKRRIIQPALLDQLARIMAEGGILRIASDVPDFVFWTLMHLRDRLDFAWTARRPEDWRVRPMDWPETRYAAKAEREGRAPCFLQYRRMATPVA